MLVRPKMSLREIQMCVMQGDTGEYCLQHTNQEDRHSSRDSGEGQVGGEIDGGLTAACSQSVSSH